MEMTGLKPDRDRIIEVALVVTDGNLVTVAEAPVWVVHQDDAVLDGMDAWNQGTHGKSGPHRQGEGVDAGRGGGRGAALAFLREHVPRQGVADVRQLDLPGPPLPRALDAARSRTGSTTATSTCRR